MSDRNQFEEWATANGYDTGTFQSGVYCKVSTAAAWDGWIGRATGVAGSGKGETGIPVLGLNQTVTKDAEMSGLTEVEARFMRENTYTKRCFVDEIPDAQTVWLKVGAQHFCVTPICCESDEDGTWTRAMLAKALAALTLDAQKEREAILIEAIRRTLNENAHLADGDVCTLIDLKRALISVGKPWSAV